MSEKLCGNCHYYDKEDLCEKREDVTSPYDSCEEWEKIIYKIELNRGELVRILEALEKRILSEKESVDVLMVYNELYQKLSQLKNF